ncbi:phosphoadenosine phosphosulfate reductase domain-containing protein [Photobacterium damselae]|uniref:phosphoadenosine phosphosulfate reductase domain-containing protein n=1 Tax=Photobacterium damselae TaxID=38293 RepID=UPI004068F2B8
MSASEKAEISINNLEKNFSSGKYMPAMMYSGGKDSSVSASLALVAWKRACDKNQDLKKIPFLIISIDTKTEQPVKQSYVGGEFESFKKFAAENNFNLFIETPSPSIGNRWAGKVVGGIFRNFSTETSKDHKCAIIWKIQTAARCLKTWEKRLSEIGLSVLQIVGSRHDESKHRAASLDKFGVNSYSIVPPTGGAVKYNTVYPVYDFTQDDIWNYLLFAENSDGAKFPAIKDGFDGTVSLYNDLAGGECSLNDQGGATCAGSRDGCWLCFASNKEYIDLSLLTTNPHVTPLAELRRFMLLNDRNAALRNYIQTATDKGKLFLKYNPNGLCGKYLLKILEIGLTIQEREKERAALVADAVERGTYIPVNGKTLDKPTFTIFEPEDILFIDLQWALRGLQLEPHAALKAYKRIVIDGERVEIPDGYLLDENIVSNLEIHGKIYLGEVENSDSESIDEIISEDMLSNGGWDADISICKAILSEDVITSWINTSTSFVKGVERILESGAISLPKAQQKAVKTRLGIVDRIYNAGLNKTAFNGGTA